jgi:flagellin-like protein
MKVWGQFRHKRFFFLKSASEAYTPVIGILLLLLITFALVGVVASSYLSFSKSDANFQPYVARISLESCEGGLYGVGPMSERARFVENRIVLVHEGGSSLPLDSTSLKISGYGNSYRGIPGHGGTPLKGNLSIFYRDMGTRGKNRDYETKNRATLKNGFWDVGEKLVLCGQDSSVSSIDSSVKVSVDGVDNTSDNYGFKAGSEITLKVIDSKGENVLAEQTAVVKLAD